eukprot:3534502-Pyramimonas_sp.AAC.1
MDHACAQVLRSNVLAQRKQQRIATHDQQTIATDSDAYAWGEHGRDANTIRRHLWESDVPESEGGPGQGGARHWSNEPDCTVGEEGLPPNLKAGLQYDMVVAADVLYFHEQV